MNLDDMKNAIDMAEKMKNMNPMEMISKNNPRFASMQSAMANPMGAFAKFGGGFDMSKMNESSGRKFGGNSMADILSAVGMMQNGNMARNSTKTPMQKIYYGLSPIAQFATPEIVYMLNKYLSTT